MKYLPWLDNHALDEPKRPSTKRSIPAESKQRGVPLTDLCHTWGLQDLYLPLILIATVSGNGGTPSGKVQFLDNGQSLGAGTLNNGTASFTTTSLSPGSHSLTASYEGDTDDGTSASSPVPVAVTPATTALTLASSANPIIINNAVTYAARVTGAMNCPRLEAHRYAWGPALFFLNVPAILNCPDAGACLVGYAGSSVESCMQARLQQASWRTICPAPK